MKEIRFIELFAGIGGFRYGLEKASKQFKCIWSNEIDKYAGRIYTKNFSKNIIFDEGVLYEGDIEKIKASKIPDHDLLTAGFPCQSFSIAGKRLGFNDTRGTLFFEIARIAKEKRPKYLLLENVKGLLSHDKGRTFRTILSTITELGYDIEWQVLNSKNYGVPQTRERVFIIGYLRGICGQQIFPIRESKEIFNGKNESKKRRTQAQYSGTIRGSNMKADHTFITRAITGGGKFGGHHSDMNLIQVNRGGSQADRIYDTKGLAKSVASQAGGLGAKTGLYAVPLKFLGRNQKNYKGKYAFTIDVSNTGGVMKDKKIRRLTPVECERLQGFPDNWTKGIVDGERYRCLGNAVTTNVITEIGKRILQEFN